jgi:uncharacterized protein YggE
MRRFLLASLCLAALTPVLRAADPVPPPAIEVTGEGEVKVEPDQVRLRFGIETFGPKLADVQNENAKRSAALIDALKKKGVKAADIQTEAVQINPRYDFDKAKRKFVEYTAHKSFVVTLNNVAGYGDALGAALDAGVDEVGGLEFLSSRMNALKDEARKAAVLDAKKRADLLAGALGQSAGRAIRIQENNVDAPQPVMFRAARMMAADAAVPDAVAPGQITVRSSVFVQFELK